MASQQPGDEYRFDGLTVFTEDWVDVWGGGLSSPIAVKWRIIGGRARVVAIRIGDEDPITARSLREPRVVEIEQRLNEYLLAEKADLEALAARDARLVDPELLRMWESEFQVHLDRLAGVEPDSAELRSRGRGAPPPTDDDYRRFAKVYLEEVVRAKRTSRGQPRGAVTATARRYGVDRSTAHRWIRECQQRGLVPQEANR